MKVRKWGKIGENLYFINQNDLSWESFKYLIKQWTANSAGGRENYRFWHCEMISFQSVMQSQMRFVHFVYFSFGPMEMVQLRSAGKWTFICITGKFFFLCVFVSKCNANERIKAVTSLTETNYRIAKRNWNAHWDWQMKRTKRNTREGRGNKVTAFRGWEYQTTRHNPIQLLANN